MLVRARRSRYKMARPRPRLARDRLVGRANTARQLPPLTRPPAMAANLAFIRQIMPLGDVLAKASDYTEVDWEIVAQIRDEAEANDTVLAALALLKQRMFRSGFSFVYEWLDTR